ncbi:MAG: leucyl/phenylalanyl-tRNA--protein transferase [Bacteroidales bacterium]|nr:leucyl/phenylalanyl-tRNA--protein transferase [Bacteroidales bacterium]
MVVRLDNDIWFPDPRDGEEDGLFAVGGDLKVDRLILAYCNGIFPWYAFREEDYEEGSHPEILWYCPMDRYVIFPDKVHISHSMRTLINSNKYHVTFNQDFGNVIKNCGDLRKDLEGAWLGPEITEAYTEMHKNNLAYSVEVWDQEENLVGGLYGVMLGKVFYGESMFSIKPNTSKLALIYLCQVLEHNGFLMVDCQFETPHLKSMGGEHISYDQYMELVEKGLD